MSYNVIGTEQQNIIFQKKSTIAYCTYRDKLQNTCPADVKILKYYIHNVKEDGNLKLTNGEVRIDDIDNEEQEYSIDACRRDSAIETPKLKTWDEYRKLVQLARSCPRTITDRTPELTHITSLQKIRIDRGGYRSKPRLSAQAKRSIIKVDVQKTILIADSNCVQFRNFKLNKLYKKTVTLQNITTSPARFQMEARPYRSKFQVLIKPVKENRNIVPPGMQLQLIVLFRCDVIDEPEEMLILNVQHGKSLIIRLHGYKDPPILLGIDDVQEAYQSSSKDAKKSLSYASRPESLLLASHDTTNNTTESISEDDDDWDDSSRTIFRNMILDCKKAFVGEETHVAMKFKNVGGEGRFFIMSEVDWASMHIDDITDKNMLTLPTFALWPAYFRMKSQEVITFHVYFLPRCYGIHVDKLYILSDNCAMLATEIIGDGIVYKTDFIQLKFPQMEKVWPYSVDKDIDKRERYYVTLNANVLDGIGQSVICVNNNSEISMHYRWEKRTMQVDEAKINELNDFPLELLRISPNHGILYPFNAHYFNVTARCNNLLPNRYSAILQLYVEDIPLAAIPKKLQLHTKECGKKRHILVADVKVWVQYMMNDEWKTSSESEELIESISETIPEYKYSLEDEETEWKDDTDDSEGYKSMRQLVADELFSHYDIVNLLQFKSLLWERIISMGIIRPTRTLYIGIEETYGLIVKNFSNNLLTYAWGDTNGFDVEKVKLCVCPEKGEIQAKNTQKIEITLLPLKEGLVESLFIPCFVGNSQKMIMLGIECFIQPLYVTFYLPLNNPEPLKARDTFARIEWRVDSLKAALDSAGKIKEGMKLLNRYKMRAERELKNTNLDQGDVLKDASVGPSVSDVGAENSNEQCSSSARTSEIIQMSKLAAEDSKHSEEDAAVSGHVVPFLETILPPLTQRDVIEFLGLSLRTVEKKTFVIKNETPIPSNFQLRLKNFYPVKCSCERKSKEDRIKFMYKQVYHRNKDLIEETLRRLKQPKSGVVIYVDPLNSDMGPFEAIPVNIYVFADTWGIYVDELDIDITGLPRYTLSVCVQVVDPPISLSICENTSTKTHHLKFGLVSAGMRLQPRKVLLKNTGVVPVAVDWHSFLISPEKEPMPFSIIYDIYTPFTDKLARELKASKQKSRSESHMEHHVTERVKSKIYEFDSIGVGDSVADASSTIPSASDEATMLTCTTFCTTSSYDFNSSVPSKSNKYVKEEVNEYMPAETKKENDSEFKVSILPYYGAVDATVCLITPREIFVLPQDSASVTITIHPDKCKFLNGGRDFTGELHCKILGFLRIAPSDKYRDNCYSRPDGNYLTPIEIDVTATIVRPQLFFDISKYDRTFTCCINDVMQNRWKSLILKKTFFFYNKSSNITNVSFETYSPFHVESVSIYTEANPCKPIRNICINGHGCAEVVISCNVEEELIETLFHTNRNQELCNSVITLEELLLIVHSDESTQDVALTLNIWLPSLKLSLYTIDFGNVYVGDAKKLTLVVENLSICNYKFNVKKKFKNEEFIIDQSKGMLTSHWSKGSIFVITISFQPKKAGSSMETLEIITNDPYTTEECELRGNGSLDEKYHIPGI